MANTAERVESNTDAVVNEQIEAQIRRNVLYFAEHPTEIPSRLGELDAEWDIERALQANAAAIGLTGALLGSLYRRKYLLLPLVVTGFLLQHAVQGWCPPLPLLRRLGFRTAAEIDRERNALKALRGDYASVPAGGDVAMRAATALRSASAGRDSHHLNGWRSTAH
jgi:hypothetical protein